MALIKKCRGKTPKIPENCWLAENATIVGDVQLGQNCSVWFSAVIRGDVNRIVIGDHCNIQDGAILHCTYERTNTTIGNYVSIGHNAIVHGCNIENNVLVGMGAIIMDGAHVKSNVLIAAGTVVLENVVLESNCIYAGVPAKKVKQLSKEKFESEVQRIANNYTLYSSWLTDD